MSAEQFPITAAQLSGILCEALFYGMYLVTCAFCARSLLIVVEGKEERWVRWREVRWTMAIIAVLLFVILTWDLAIGILHLFDAFIKAANATIELTNIGGWINIARSVNQAAAMIIGDFVLIYRCWIVYQRRWPVIIPSLVLFLGSIAMAVKVIETEWDPATLKTKTSSSQVRPWYATLFGVNAVQNFLTTGLLIWCIWRVERRVDQYLDHTDIIAKQLRYPQKVMRIVAESGAAYTIMVIATFVVDISGSNALYPTSDMTLQATGIAFNVILIRTVGSSTNENQ